ncbi:MAG: DUF1802 family protein [Gemmataceae bacterium]|nr:DUF1802 family protein [Gemmataceae bacterium]
MLQYAFKEWAVICRALELGKQSILLRKGGIAEDFRLEHQRFWFFSTYVHQQQDGIRPDAASWLEAAMRDRPPAGKVRLSHWAEATGIRQLRDLAPALRLAPLHFWSDETVRKRFEYRVPGLNVFAVRVHRAETPVEIDDTAEYQGCRSWVTLDQALPTAGSTPVLDDAAFRDVTQRLEVVLNPTATA